jgi:uncharacterized membrane protein YciS (DUF1049 family)
MEFVLTLLVVIFFAGFVFSRIIPWLLRFWLKKEQKKATRFTQKKRIDQSCGDYIDYEEIV